MFILDDKGANIKALFFYLKYTKKLCDIVWSQNFFLKNVIINL